MFEFVRRHNKLLQFVLLLLIFPSFVLFGIQGYESLNQKGETVAEVDGQPITRPEWEQAHQAEVDNLRRAMPQLDAQIFESASARQATLDRLVRERVLQAAAHKLHLQVSEQRVAQTLKNNPQIAALKGPDGRIDTEALQQMLSAQGMRPDVFMARVQQELSMQQVMQGVNGSSLHLQALSDGALQALHAAREAQVLHFKPADFVQQIKAREEELQSHYQKNAARFSSPESAEVEYLLLDLEQLRKNISVSEAEIKTHYEQNAARFSSPEERRASHILITADTSPAARQKARETAQALLQQVREQPSRFAELAQKHSQDRASAAQGGDLGFFVRESMVKPFADAAFVLKKGEISEPIETDFGFHIIRLTDIKSAKQRSLAELRPQIENEIKKQSASKKFAEMAEALNNALDEQADNLQAVADRLQLKLYRVSKLSRQGQPSTPPLNNAKLLAALFSADAIQSKRNTAAIEVGPNQLAAARIAQYQAARTLSFAEAKEQVLRAYVQEQSLEWAQRKGQEQLEALRKNNKAPAGAARIELSRDKSTTLNPRIVEAALSAATDQLPLWLGVDLGPQGYAVVRINKVLPPKLPVGHSLQQEALQQQQAWSKAEAQAYYQNLQTRFKASTRAKGQA